MRVYHRTSRAAAERILRAGFCDDAALIEYSLWVSVPPYDIASLPLGKREALLAVDLPEHELAPYEVQTELPAGVERPPIGPGGDYREWIVPAAILNQWPVVVVEEEK